VPQLLILLLFSPFGLTIESIKGIGGALITIATITIIIIILKGIWINTHNIATVIKDSATTTSAKDSTVMRSADKGE
jgi:FtsZ-interacting cell division protein ZipA